MGCSDHTNPMLSPSQGKGPHSRLHELDCAYLLWYDVDEHVVVCCCGEEMVYRASGPRRHIWYWCWLNYWNALTNSGIMLMSLLWYSAGAGSAARLNGDE